MGRRDKTKFEKWFSFSRHKRRIGGRQYFKDLDINFQKQKKQVIAGNKKIYTHGSYDKIDKQFEVLKYEFIGQSELCLTCAKIIVLIRRECEIKKHYALLEDLWNKEKTHLLKNLNTRWLISVVDTFSDHSKNDTDRALSVACSCLINTIKIQETERYIIDAKNNKDNKDRLLELQNGRVALFDGTSAFAVGTDDTLRNMRWRIDKLSKVGVSGEILLEVFMRLQKHDTVYKRFKDRHTRNKTGWW